MIHVNANEEVEDGGTVHLWLESMVEDRKKAESALYFPEEPALCGNKLGDLDLPPSDRHPNNHVKRASATVFGDSLGDLLNHEQVCVECKLRAAVYYDVVEVLAIDLTEVRIVECTECETTRHDAPDILGVANEGVRARLECPECDNEEEITVAFDEVEG